MSGATKLLFGLTPIFGTSMVALAAGASALDGVSSYLGAEARARNQEALGRNARQAAKNRADQERASYRKLTSSRRAAAGASGLDVNTGSVLDLQAGIEAEGEVSSRNILYEGELDAANWRQRAASSRQGGRSALGRGLIDGAATGLLGLGRKGYGYWGLSGPQGGK